jgi:hypothetical protein
VSLAMGQRMCPWQWGSGCVFGNGAGCVRGNGAEDVRVRTLIKKEKHNFLVYKEIQSGAVAKSYMWKGFLIYEEMRKYFPIYEEAVSHI